MQNAKNKINQVAGWPEKKKLFSHSSVYKAKNLANKQEELELLPDEHKLDLLGFIKESGGESHLTGTAKFMVISYLRRTELQKRRGNSLTNPLQMVLSTLLQEKVQSGCFLLSTAGSRIAGGSRMTGFSHPSEISIGKTLCSHKISIQATLRGSQQEAAGMVLLNP